LGLGLGLGFVDIVILPKVEAFEQIADYREEELRRGKYLLLW
jgi:hypothetical protein